MHLNTKLRLALLVVMLVPLTIIFAMVRTSSLYADPLFSRIAAAALAGSLLAVIVMPAVIVNWLVGKSLKRMSALCSRVKQGEYQELLSLPNEQRDSDDEDGIIMLMRDMNWMARQIEIREKELQQAVDELVQVNTELIATQERLQDRTNELEAVCKQMQVMAMTDPLTSMANRRCFFKELEGQFAGTISEHQPVSLLMIDVDWFKKINDTYGHQAGDRVLLELAGIIKENIRTGDLAARIGGEEYALLLPNTDPAGALNAACRITMAVAGHTFLVNGDMGISVTVSIGVCTMYQYPCLCIERFYKYADQALYHSKRNGRNAVSVYDTDSGEIRIVGCH